MTDQEIIEAMARAMAQHDEDDALYVNSNWENYYELAEAALKSIEPLIAQREREKVLREMLEAFGGPFTSSGYQLMNFAREHGNDLG